MASCTKTAGGVSRRITLTNLSEQWNKVGTTVSVKVTSGQLIDGSATLNDEVKFALIQIF